MMRGLATLASRGTPDTTACPSSEPLGATTLGAAGLPFKLVVKQVVSTEFLGTSLTRLKIAVSCRLQG